MDRLRDVLAPIPVWSTRAVARRLVDHLRRTGKRRQPCRARAWRVDGAGGEGVRIQLARWRRCSILALPESQRGDGDALRRLRQPAEVVAYAREFLAGLAAQGVAGCGKHFPGLGGGTLDSHLETPEIRRTWQQMWQEDLEPYRALRDQLPMVMVNHAAYPADDRQEAAGERVELLDQAMCCGSGSAIAASFSRTIWRWAAWRSSCRWETPRSRPCAWARTLLLICHHPEPILNVYEALITEGERSAAFGKMLLARARESARKRAKIFPAEHAGGAERTAV